VRNDLNNLKTIILICDKERAGHIVVVEENELQKDGKNFVENKNISINLYCIASYKKNYKKLAKIFVLI